MSLGNLAERNSNAVRLLETTNLNQSVHYRNPTAVAHRIDPLQKMRWERNGSQVRSPSKNTKLSQRTSRAGNGKTLMHEVFFETVSCFWRGTWPVNHCVPTEFLERVDAVGQLVWNRQETGA